LLKQMKRILQFAALAVVALLTAQPALAGLLCHMGNSNGGSQAHCSGMAMSEMGMQCPMHRHPASIGCEQNCCKEGIPQGVVRLAADRKPKTGKTEFLALAPRTAADDVTALAAPPLDRKIASGPARYVLLQVFRI
jgi:hypothetical protein